MYFYIARWRYVVIVARIFSDRNYLRAYVMQRIKKDRRRATLHNIYSARLFAKVVLGLLMEAVDIEV